MEDFILWMIGAPLLGIGIVTVLGSLKRRSMRRSQQQQIVRCRACGHLFQDLTRDRSPACPECGRPNHRGDSRRLG